MRMAWRGGRATGDGGGGGPGGRPPVGPPRTTRNADAAPVCTSASACPSDSVGGRAGRRGREGWEGANRNGRPAREASGRRSDLAVADEHGGPPPVGPAR